jgi:hypothetical protein
MTNAAVGAGVALLANVASGGRIGDMLVDATWGRRHELGFALRHVLQPGVVIDAYRSSKDAEAMQHEHWGAANHNDDAIDAMRHSYAAGLLAARLVHDRGLSTDAAQALTVEAGHAHELDGIDHHERTAGRRAVSSAMDEHNNAAGARVGAGLAEQLGAVPSSDTLLDALRSAASAGELVVIDDGAPRPMTPADVPAWRSS